jgi:hypothetical protein
MEVVTAAMATTTTAAAENVLKQFTRIATTSAHHILQIVPSIIP